MRWFSWTAAFTAAFFMFWGSAQAIDLKDCDGNTVDDSAFDEPIIRDHRDQTYGALGNGDVRPLGGGEDYTRIVARPETVVRTADELRAALAAGSEGARTIYIDDAAEMDLSYCNRSPTPAGCFEPRSGPSDCGAYTLRIPSNTTLASGRGRPGSRGAFLYSRTFTECPLFRPEGENIRITGLRLMGPDPTIENDALIHCGGEATAIALQADGPSRWATEIDNNEFTAWPRAAIAIGRVMGVQIHHNIFQFNRRQEHNNTCGPHNYGLGYGVVVGPGSASITANVFDHNRHDIASDGSPGTHYLATYNLVLAGAVQHSFDVHGGKDRGDCTDVAGSAFVVHHNSFLQAHKPAFRMRGIPMRGAWIYKNATRDDSAGDAFNQVNASGNFHRSDNRTNANDFPAWFISHGGASFWQWRRFERQGMADLAAGDFNGDGAMDAMRATASGWQWSRSARDGWAFLNAATDAVSNLRFGDFAGSGLTDIIRAQGHAWEISEGGTAPWRPLLSPARPLAQAAFADFEGDGKTDAFFADGTGWTIVQSFSPPIRRHYNEPYKLSELRFGQFTGDAKWDVVRQAGAAWLVWDHGTRTWNPLNTSNYKIKDMTFADFNGDGLTDILRFTDGKWFVSWSGAGAWAMLNTSDVNPRNQLVADFNGDGKADVLSQQAPGE